jgi:hypothetical protein
MQSGSPGELPSQFFDREGRERIEDRFEVALDPEVEYAIGVPDHETEMVTVLVLDPEDLPVEVLAALLLEAEGGEVANRLRDEILVRHSGGQMQPDLDTAVRGRRKAVPLMASSPHRTPHPLDRSKVSASDR